MLISSRDNPKIKEYVKLRDKKSARDSEGLFVLEGQRIISDALKENVPLRSVFYTEAVKNRYSELISRIEELLGDKAFEVSEQVSVKLSDTLSTQGIFAIASRLDKNLPLDKIVYGGKFLILNSLRNPGNVGTVLRAADAMGVAGVYLCDCCDIYNPKTVRSTMGSLFRVPFCDSICYKDVVSMMKSSGIGVYASVVDRDAINVREFSFPESCAVVIGNEGNGLSREDADICDAKITIRMSGTVESLNAAAAATVFLWELTK